MGTISFHLLWYINHSFIQQHESYMIFASHVHLWMSLYLYFTKHPPLRVLLPLVVQHSLKCKSSLTHSLVSGWSLANNNWHSRLGLNSLVRKSYYNQTRLHIPDLIVCDIHPLLGSSCRDCIIRPTYFQVQSYISTKFDKFYFLYLPNLFLI